MAARRQGWGSLTPDLWGKVFSLLDLERRPFAFEPWVTNSMPTLDLQQRLQLRTVCKVFNALHTFHMHHLTIRGGVSHAALPRLIGWLSRSKPQLISVKLGHSECLVIPAVLETLACANTPLTMFEAKFGQTHKDVSLETLFPFRMLTGCALTNHFKQDLAPLQQLPFLTSLSLRGCFCNLEKLAHLTQLCLWNSHTSRGCPPAVDSRG